jgi:hypothetical protein
MANHLRVFKTDKRIKLGIWGLGRGMSFFKTCESLNFDVVAGCDFNAHMRDRFKACQPGAFVTGDAEEFLKQDFDAVLLATFCPAHADDAIRCMAAGKHVLSEVTAFHTMAEGVRLVEAVEKTGKIYNLAENYPFSPANMYLARKWREGLFGELMYAEYEYVHECRSLVYTYIDGVPVQPGNTVHNWRSWLNFHYYCTHSLGPVMVITGTRPVRVESLPGTPGLAGYLMKNEEGMAGVTPSLIRMSNGGLVRNLMGCTTNDSHMQRLWGTLGAAEINCGKGLQLRLGASGGSPKLEVNPALDELGALAAKTGHGGGDFWVLYYFARQILTGEAAPFDVYGACDVTIPGLLAFRSSCEGGKPYDVPDFRKKTDRNAWRGDDWAQKRYDVRKGCFPAGADPALTGRFSGVMKDLIRLSTAYRAFADWERVRGDLTNPGSVLALCAKVADNLDGMLETYGWARKIADAYPASDGARVLREMLEVGCEAEVMKPGFKAALRRTLAALIRKYGEASQSFGKAEMSALQPAVRDVRRAVPPGRGVKWMPAPWFVEAKLIDIRQAHGGKDGLVYIRGKIKQAKPGPGELLVGSDGPFRLWLNGKPVGAVTAKSNPATPDEFRYPVKWKKGVNTVLAAQLTNKGNAWGMQIRGA